MNSKERLQAAWRGEAADHIPLTFQCFGNLVPRNLRWTRESRRSEVRRWYTKRLEDIQTLPVSWTLDDDFRRVLAWLSLGVDDLVDVSIPWSVHPEVNWTNSRRDSDRKGQHPLLIREYETPAGTLRHQVRHTNENLGEGWVIQPDQVSLMEDFNIPRGVEHAVSSIDDVPRIRFLYAPPDADARRWLEQRMERISAFSSENGVAVQAWAAFGMDAVIWLCGTEGAFRLATEQPRVFAELVEIVRRTDHARVELAARQPGIDLIVERGWYSCTDFWSPALFDQFLLEPIRQLADLCHRHDKLFCYTVPNGIEVLGPKLADAGVDVLYFLDPVRDGIAMDKAAELLGSRMCLVGGINTSTLATRNRAMIEEEVHQAVSALGPTGRFILHASDALFPDTPWEGVEMLIQAWKKYRQASLAMNSVKSAADS